ncbi:MAG: D-2-hydroxyacid dehydrogenase [Abditibacteriales bacterium]|nr:D-2-hydroxyacid dehydrogenase [Abditibacteriales bacterium]MDW8366373.1 D-2-hydroxyacid dehydrogenase [Abditibacteriales bacterium]
MKLLIHPPTSDEWLSAIRNVSSELQVVNAPDPATALREVADADCFFGIMTQELLHAASKLRWIQAPMIGLERYMFPELIEHPVVLTNMRGTFSDVIADHVLGFILCFARGFHRFRDAQAQREWAGDYDFMYLPDHTLGIIGLGGIGREVARRGHCLGMRVIAIDPRTKEAEHVQELRGAEALPWLLNAADFVAICAPHTPQTEKMIRRAQLRQMKKTAFLINVGRGIIVDLQDLTDALQAGEIAGAGLDVFETEPLPSDHPLWTMPNVIITPHVAGVAPRIVGQRQLGVLLDNLRRFLNDEPLNNVVAKEQWF